MLKTGDFVKIIRDMEDEERRSKEDRKTKRREKRLRGLERRGFKRVGRSKNRFKRGKINVIMGRNDKITIHD